MTNELIIKDISAEDLNNESVFLEKNKKFLSEESLKKLNELRKGCPDIADTIKDNFVTYADILKNPEWSQISPEQYASAITFCSLRACNWTPKDAWIKVFPDRWKLVLSKNKSEAHHAAMVSAYERSRLVVAIKERAHIPIYILNQEMVQEALNVLRDTMLNDKTTPKVKVEAANSILNNLKRPESLPSVNVNMVSFESEALKKLKEDLLDVSKKQLKVIEATGSVEEIL